MDCVYSSLEMSYSKVVSALMAVKSIRTFAVLLQISSPFVTELKISKSDCQLQHFRPFSCLSFRMDKRIFHWTKFKEISYLGIFLNSLWKIQFSLKWREQGVFLRRPRYIQDIISPCPTCNEKFQRNQRNVIEKIKTLILYSISFSPKSNHL